ncbi:hypothetical protein A2V61_02285 [Candidatus Woesebacteria bacterium RBG_19FT_COMBO_47_8]|uniref:Uncharacterized protein n=1 Tax=Candidatus Woesebacteria bacterium RBG_13_46_13 TaxID=1802479 RepID=A0A1F7X496_9BACT|nr:MAG: hypothetical protein A2Y68_00655 [Candidatus Woesebacteria bacterium RBG_13_46_13]OGM17439.1 MAG: hypothetical protein A2V61_02285 [Candidatus Woesebacteria bacterium RBG_19FT_COMBO_47_8]HJX59425.1 hypothetical protein [Patescibacteria group bacterium]
MEAQAYFNWIRRRAATLIVVSGFLIVGAIAAFLFGRPVVGMVLLLGGFIPGSMAGTIGSASEQKGCFWFAASIICWLAFLGVVAWAVYANLFG